MSSELDALDIDLLKALAEHTRISVLELSRTLKVARGTVQSRLDRLEEAGVIRGYQPDIDVVQAGYGVHAFVTLQITQGALHEIAEELAEQPAVLEAYATTGSSDVICRLAASSHEELQQILLALNRSPSIGRTTSVIVLSDVVRRRAIPLLASTPRRAPKRAPSYSAT
jgi:DNA-binding Lrp family transcriptional regulator